MHIRILFFASLARRLQVQEMDLEVSDNATVDDAVDVLAGRYPDLEALRDRLAYAVDMAYVGRDHRLAAGDELALIPPVSGG